MIAYGGTASLASCFWRTVGSFNGVLMSDDIRRVIM